MPYKPRPCRQLLRSTNPSMCFRPTLVLLIWKMRGKRIDMWRQGPSACTRGGRQGGHEFTVIPVRLLPVNSIHQNFLLPPLSVLVPERNAPFLTAQIYFRSGCCSDWRAERLNKYRTMNLRVKTPRGSHAGPAATDPTAPTWHKLLRTAHHSSREATAYSTWPGRTKPCETSAASRCTSSLNTVHLCRILCNSSMSTRLCAHVSPMRNTAHSLHR